MHPGSAQATTPWYRQFWPWFIIALPACAVVASIATLIIAASGNDTLVVADYNRIEELTAQGQARDAGAVALGLVADLRMTADSRSVAVQVSAVTQPGVRWRPDRLRLNVRHPTRQAADQSIVLARQDTDHYSGQLTGAPTDRVYLELLPEAEPDDVRPDWRLTAEWVPGRAGVSMSASPPP